MSDTSCGCSGGAPSFPQPTDNPPQLDALRRRIGTHGSFLAALKAGLSAAAPLAHLTARDDTDPTIALLDAWATVADVLTFYQERFANEAYLRTATERRSVLELARLVDYDLRPGVSASLPLAFTLDATDPKARATVPAGTPAQSIPGPGEVPQTFETSDDLPARAEWNLLPVRSTQPQVFDLSKPDTLKSVPTLLSFQGVANNLKAGDALLLVAGDGPGLQYLRRVVHVETDPVGNRTQVTLEGPAPVLRQPPPTLLSDVLNRLDERITLNRRPVVPTDRTLLTTLQLGKSDGGATTARADVAGRLLVAVQPALRDVLYQALQNQPPAKTLPQIEVYVYRAQTGVFGANASRKQPRDARGNTDAWVIMPEDADPNGTLIWLDTPLPQLALNNFITVRTLDAAGTATDLTTHVTAAAVASRSDYNLSARTMRVVLADRWYTAETDPDPAHPPTVTAVDRALTRLRQTTVFSQPEQLTLAEVPITDDTTVGQDRVTLDAIVPELDAGRLILFSGERADLGGVSGVPGSELARLAAVEVLDPSVTDAKGNPPTDESGIPVTRRLSVLHLDSQLSYTYRRSTLKIYSNVVLATNGESRDEVLGGGDASDPWSAYPLRQFPVTQLPAPNPSGTASTLQVRVHGVLWHEVGHGASWNDVQRLADAGPKDQVYETKTDNDGHTTVIFGDGVHGARPATDVENIRATLRVGLGQGGNVRAGQVSLLTRPPAGVQFVTNPLPGTGGADPEGRDRARRNAPLGTLTLDRLVSLTDYAAFARSFAGIGKAEAVELSDARGRFIQLTVAGADDLPLAPESDLLVNLRQALALDGDPRQLVQIDPRERVLLVLQAGVRIDPDYLWPDLEAALRQALVAGFPFENRGMGRDMFLSEVVAVLQGVAGVLDVEVDVFAGVSERTPGTYTDSSGNQATGRLLLTPDQLAQAIADAVSRALPPPGQGKGPLERVAVLPAGIDNGTVRPAQIAYFGPETLDVLKAAVTFRRIV